MLGSNGATAAERRQKPAAGDCDALCPRVATPEAELRSPNQHQKSDQRAFHQALQHISYMLATMHPKIQVHPNQPSHSQQCLLSPSGNAPPNSSRWRQEVLQLSEASFVMEEQGLINCVLFSAVRVRVRHVSFHRAQHVHSFSPKFSKFEPLIQQ